MEGWSYVFLLPRALQRASTWAKPCLPWTVCIHRFPRICTVSSCCPICCRPAHPHLWGPLSCVCTPWSLSAALCPAPCYLCSFLLQPVPPLLPAPQCLNHPPSHHLLKKKKSTTFVCYIPVEDSRLFPVSNKWKTKQSKTKQNCFSLASPCPWHRNPFSTKGKLPAISTTSKPSSSSWVFTTWLEIKSAMG